MIGEGSQMVEDDSKTSKPRVIDLDPDTSAELRAWKSARGSMALALAKLPVQALTRSALLSPGGACRQSVCPKAQP